jgi:hypothetical protein
MSSSSADWEAIGQTRNALILYHPASHELSVQQRVSGPDVPISPLDESPADTSYLPLTRVTSSGVNDVVLSRHPAASHHSVPDGTATPIDLCPYCYQALPSTTSFPGGTSSVPPSNTTRRTSPFGFGTAAYQGAEIHPIEEPTPPPAGTSSSGDTLQPFPPYFRILEKAHDAQSRPPTRSQTPTVPDDSASSSPSVSERGTPLNGRASGIGMGRRVEQQEEQTPLRGVEGYYSRFFVEEKRLGMGAEGSVFLCQVGGFAWSRTGWQAESSGTHAARSRRQPFGTLCRQKDSGRLVVTISLQDAPRGQTARNATPSQHHPVPPCLDGDH